jgi:hypothetical protein
MSNTPASLGRYFRERLRVHRHDDLVVLVGVSPDLGIGRARNPDVRDVNGGHALGGEALHHRR